MSRVHDLGSPSRCINPVHDLGSRSRRINRVHASNSKTSRLIRINEPVQPPVSSTGLTKPCQSAVSPPASRHRAEIVGFPLPHRPARRTGRSAASILAVQETPMAVGVGGSRSRWLAEQPRDGEHRIRPPNPILAGRRSRWCGAQPGGEGTVSMPTKIYLIMYGNVINSCSILEIVLWINAGDWRSTMRSAQSRGAPSDKPTLRQVSRSRYIYP